MQLSCLPVSFFRELQEGRMTVADWARMAARIGLEALDLSIAWVSDHSPAALAAMRREIEGAGMSVGMITTYPDFSHPDTVQRERELALAQETVQVARALGARLLRLTAGQAHPETPREPGIAWVVEGFRRLMATNAPSGVTLVYENHSKPFIWQYTDFSQEPSIFLEIVARTAELGLGINFDTANATAFSADPLALLEAVVGRVASVHAADTAVKGALQMVLLGTGLAPFSAIFKRLKRAGYDGWVCMEEGSRQGEAGIRAAARFVRDTWQEA